MSPEMLTILQWFAAGSAAVAALIVASDLGRKWTGAGFVIFVASSIAWITYGLLDPQPETALAALNFALLAINIFGVWQYLLSPKNRKKMEIVEEAVAEAEAKGEI